jgi:heme-degrading monooxygenase HmoA
MFVIRETFTAKPGMASKLAAMFKEVLKEVASSVPGMKMRVLTDTVGPFNTVVWEAEIGAFSDFEKLMKEYESRSDIREKMKGYTDMYVSGGREIYRVV